MLYWNDIALENMDEEGFPKELTEALVSTLTTYKELGWREIDLGWPTGSRCATNTIFLHATSPSGQRVHAVFDDDYDIVQKIGRFLDHSG